MFLLTFPDPPLNGVKALFRLRDGPLESLWVNFRLRANSRYEEHIAVTPGECAPGRAALLRTEFREAPRALHLAGLKLAPPAPNDRGRRAACSSWDGRGAPRGRLLWR